MARLVARIATITVITLVGCREIREVAVDPQLDTTAASDSTDPSSTAGGSSTTTPIDVDTAEPAPTGETGTGAPPVAAETFCGDRFVVGPDAVSPVLVLDDDRTIASIDVILRVAHADIPSLEIAVRRDDVRRVLLAPDRIDCGAELNAQFSDDGDVALEQICSSGAEVVRVVPVESLAVLADAPLSGDWILEASGAVDATQGEVSAWCLAVRFDPG